MRKLCIIYNFAQKYREAIYRLMDKEWDCDWYFGTNDTDIEGFDLSLLNNAKLVQNKLLKKPFYYQKGVINLLLRKEYDTFLMLGEFNSLSTWIMLMLKPIMARKKKIFLWTHGWYGREGKVKKILKRLFFNFADGIFLYGNYARNLMIEYGFEQQKLFVIHNSLDYQKQKEIRNKITDFTIYRRHFGNSDYNIIFIGRLTTVKRIDLLIKAIGLLQMEGFNLNLTLIGDGKEKECLKSLVDVLKLEKKVWFYGACYDDNKNATLIYNADLCVAPGNVGLTAMHTMAFGTPVLTHNNFPLQMPEFESIKDGVTGGFFEYGDVNSLARAIKDWIIKHAKNRDTTRIACYKEIEESWNPQYQLKILKSNLKC